ncbi:MAG: SDR family NAD(P)-dependent oxidoreductase [Micrococcales bacterium]|nr:SDR family NAD(P)-dependent oxidoreductase [Micrococcales bacterium]
MKAEHLVDAALEFSVVGSFSRIGYAVRSRLAGWDTPTGLAGRRVLLTGGTSGVGLAAARTLTGLGAQVAITGRSRARLDGAAREIAAHGEDPITLVADSADLQQLPSMFDAAVSGLGGLDVVINNAGALTHEYSRSPQGFETTYAVHVLAPFLLTRLAVPVVGPQGRVITVSSGGMYSQSLHPDMQCGPEGFDGVTAYAKAKRAQVALNQEWARRHPAGPTFAAMHPGWADTPGVRTSLPTFRRVTGPVLRTPEQGADTMVWLASADVPSGGFWLDRRRRAVVRLPRTSHTAHDAEALFEVVSEQVASAV